MYRIETDRLIIRPTQNRDLTPIHEILKDEDTMRFFVEGTYSRDKVKEVINRNEKEVNHYTVMIKDSYRVIGKLSFNDWFMKDTKEIGWIFNKLAWGNGYATEAAKAMIDYAFNNLNTHRIIATCQPENLASKRICEKIGMIQEANFKQSIYVKDDIWWDELHFGILKSTYFQHN